MGKTSGLTRERANRKKKTQISPLRCAPPDFLWNLMALAHFMLLSLTKAAHAAMSDAAWQEIRVRSR
jgi:putative copper export protein